MDYELLKKLPGVVDIAYETYAINEYGLDAMFLLVGQERALLIDTGTGLCDLPLLVKTITDKPLTVALTHGHVDHAGGMGAFDQVYAHPDDFDMALHVTVEARRGYAAGLLKLNPAAPVTVQDLRIHEKLPKMEALQEGDVIDLGGRKVMVFETPGHTPGGLSFLDVRERIIITGDACNGNTLLLPFGGVLSPKQTVSTLKATAEKLISLAPLYNRNYNGHVGYGGSPGCRPQPESISRDVADLCTQILAGTAHVEDVPLTIPGREGSIAHWARSGAAGIRYTDGSVK